MAANISTDALPDALSPDALPDPSFDQPVPMPAARVGLCTQSCKAKGRRHQQWVEKELKKASPHLVGNDIRSISMGAAGDDLMLSPAALEVYPYNFEMKNVEHFQVWATLVQVNKRYRESQRQGQATVPCVVAKRNRTDPVVVIPYGHLCNLMRMALGTVPGVGVQWLPECLTLADTHALLPAEGIQDLESLLRATWPHPVLTKAPLLLTSTTPVGQYHLHLYPKSVFNFWQGWGEWHGLYKKTKHQPEQSFACIFNRNQADHVVYAALKFPDFVQLVLARWAYVQQQRLGA